MKIILMCRIIGEIKKTDDSKEMMKNGLREKEDTEDGKINVKIHSGMRERPKRM